MDFEVLLVGTDHGFQNGSKRFSPQQHQAFCRYIKSIISDRSVMALAEENSKSAVSEAGASSSMLKLISDELRLTHRYCDPDQAERAKLGIFSENEIQASAFIRGLTESQRDEQVRSSFMARESIWFEHLRTLNIWPCLFICGSNHVISFEAMLKSKRYQVEILDPDWKP